MALWNEFTLRNGAGLRFAALCAQWYVSLAHAAGHRPGRQTWAVQFLGYGVRIMSMASIFGVLVIALGIFLWIGNVSRMFPTIPLAGYITIVIGGVIYRAGNKG